jgi:putative hydrolase of the HAD superfamily
VPQVVIFDWFGTLAEWPHGSTSNYASVFLRHGHTIDPAVFDRHHTRWDGIDHAAHSVSRRAYVAWTRQRLVQLTEECGVAVSEREVLVDALVEVDQRTSLVVFPDTAVVLAALRQRNLAVGVCSNWGWDLGAALDATGVTPLIDVAVTSARAGYHKPHPGLYASVLARSASRPTRHSLSATRGNPMCWVQSASGCGQCTSAVAPARTRYPSS